MFHSSKKKNWMLRLVDEEISPVSWNMVKHGLKKLRHTEDDSFLVLTKNPDGPDEQFLQAALPRPSSGQAPLYSIQTAVNENGQYRLYVKPIAELSDVVAFFEDYFRTGELDISLFAPDMHL